MIPFNKSFVVGTEISNIKIAQRNGILSGDGYFTKKAHDWLIKNLNTKKALLTHSCTAALELAALTLGLKKDDEVIMPSYTFVSTANAFVLMGVKPIFVDIDIKTLCIDENLILKNINKKTKAIVVVNYAGISCDFDKIKLISRKYKIPIIEDAAQSILSTYKKKYLGTIGDLGCLSFHETKNITCGEGGALLINNKKYYEKAITIREKGTNRTKFFKGEVDKYTWVSKGSSYLPGELNAAYLYSQLLEAKKITNRRIKIWNNYNSFFKKYEKSNIIKRPFVPQYNKHNAHMFYVLFNNKKKRDKFIDLCKSSGLSTVFHYIPLHNSPAGKKYSEFSGSMKNTKYVSETIVRFPLWIGIEKKLKNIFKILEKNLRKI